MGSEYWRMNARQRGSARPAASVLGPNRPARDAASAELRPCRGSASSARSTSSALSVCHAASGASAWRSAPGTSISLVCTGHPPSRRATTETTRTPPSTSSPRAHQQGSGPRLSGRLSHVADLAEAGDVVADHLLDRLVRAACVHLDLEVLHDRPGLRVQRQGLWLGRDPQQLLDLAFADHETPFASGQREELLVAVDPALLRQFLHVRYGSAEHVEPARLSSRYSSSPADNSCP